MASIRYTACERMRTPDGDKLDVLIVLVEDYENKHHPSDPPDPIEAIKFHMEQMGLTRRDLESYLGSRGREPIRANLRF